MDMKFRAKARRKAKKRRVCPANFTRQQNKMAAKDTQIFERNTLSTSNEQQCTTITPNTTSDTFKTLKYMSEKKITRSSKIYQQKLSIDTACIFPFEYIRNLTKKYDLPNS